MSSLAMAIKRLTPALRMFVKIQLGVPRRTVKWFILPACLFSCFYATILLLSDEYADEYGLSLIVYLSGLFALLAVFRFRGLSTALGALITVFVARYYFVPLLVKTFEGHAIWHKLRSPEESLLVVMYVLITMVLVSAFFREKANTEDAVYASSEALHLRRLIIVAFLLGLAATLQAAATEQLGQLATAEPSGSFLGGAGPIFQALLAFSLALAVYSVLVHGRSVLRSPGVVSLLAINVLFSFTSTSRSSLLMIMLAMLLPHAFARRRIQPLLLAIVLVGSILFTLVVNPTIIYLRTGNMGNVQFSSLSERVDKTTTFWEDSLANPESISTYQTSVAQQGHYLDYFDNYYGGLERFAILPDNDRLINGTVLSDQYGGWHTIGWAFSLVPPRFLYPDKPVMAPGAYLGKVAGLAAPGDERTQWAFGFPGELYHAFSYLGVFLGSIGILSLFAVVLKMFEVFGVFPAWKMLIVMYYWNTFSEGSLATIFSTLVPLVVLVVVVDRAVRYTGHWRFSLRFRTREARAGER